MDISGLSVRGLLALHVKIRDRLRELKPDLDPVGQDIYAALHPAKRKRVEFQTLISDKLYSPSEVAEILSVSYNTALR